jgi:hypothetical protein
MKKNFQKGAQLRFEPRTYLAAGIGALTTQALSFATHILHYNLDETTSEFGGRDGEVKKEKNKGDTEHRTQNTEHRRTTK